MSAWATAEQLRERMDAAWGLYVDACSSKEGLHGMDRFIAHKQCEARLREWKRLHDRHAKAVEREHKRRHYGRK